MKNYDDYEPNNAEYYDSESGLSPKTKKGFLIAGIILAVIILCVVAFIFGYKIFNDTQSLSGDGDDVKVTITEEMSKSDVASLLKENGLIDSPMIFKIQISLFTSDNYGIIPGEYVLNTSMTHKQMIEAMSGVITKETKETEHLGIKD